MNIQHKLITYAAVSIVSTSVMKADEPVMPDEPIYEWGKHPTSPPPGFDFPKLSSQLPYDIGSLGDVNAPITKDDGNIIAVTQKQFDIFSWSTFVALNWAADNQGNAMSAVPIGSCNSATRVWEHYMAPRNFFKSDGEEPDVWGTPDHLSKTFHSSSKKTHHVLDEVDEAFFNLETPMPPITDLNNAYVRYEVRFNKEEYDYMYPFNTIAKQKAYANGGGSFSFPQGKAKTKNSPGRMGAMELKIAWKKMGENDDPTKFYTVDATVYDPFAPKNKAVKKGLYGMVGMHIAVRTESAPQWAWATFEHVDNAPTVDFSQKPQSKVYPQITNGKPKHYSFWNAEGENSIAGFDETVYAKLVALGKKNKNSGDYYQDIELRSPTQIAQVINQNNEVLKSKWTKTLNKTMQKKLEGTVWANYRLITTQRPTQPDAPIPNGYGISLGKPAPVSIGNPVMETYLQFNGSCMACHAGATTTFKIINEKTKKKSDVYTNFSFMLQRAK